MTESAFVIAATLADGVLCHDEPLPPAPRQRVVLTVQIPERAEGWPENVGPLYREIAESDRALSAAMSPIVAETWPAWEEDP